MLVNNTATPVKVYTQYQTSDGASHSSEANARAHSRYLYLRGELVHRLGLGGLIQGKSSEEAAMAILHALAQRPTNGMSILSELATMIERGA